MDEMHVRSPVPTVLMMILTLPVCGHAFGADASGAPTDKSIYGVLNPTPDSALRAFSPDRPARSTSPITVDAGRVQIESDFLNYTFSNQGGASTRTFQAGDPVIKLGVNDVIDVEVAFSGFLDTRTTDNRTHETLSKGSGFGDVTLTAKINLVGNEGGQYAFALVPYLRVPSGTRNVSDDQVEGGLIAPLTVSLPNDFNMTLQTEFDALRNSNDSGTHVNFTNIVNISHAIPGIKNLTGTAELYSSLDTEAHTPDVYTFDVALAYLIEPDLQVDVGANIGLNRGAPDYQVYSGIAHRF